MNVRSERQAYLCHFSYSRINNWLWLLPVCATLTCESPYTWAQNCPRALTVGVGRHKMNIHWKERKKCHPVTVRHSFSWHSMLYYFSLPAPEEEEKTLGNVVRWQLHNFGTSMQGCKKLERLGECLLCRLCWEIAISFLQRNNQIKWARLLSAGHWQDVREAKFVGKGNIHSLRCSAKT